MEYGAATIDKNSICQGRRNDGYIVNYTCACKCIYIDLVEAQT